MCQDDSDINNCNCLFGEYVLGVGGTQGSATYQIQIKWKVSASENASQNTYILMCA